MREFRIGNVVVSRTVYYRRRRRAKQLGCAIEDVPDMRGRHSEGHRGPGNPRWNHGRLLTSHGYVLVRVPPSHPHAFGGRSIFAYCYEHIKIMVEHLGRPLLPGEVVHHKNGDQKDNRLENLEVLQSSEHMSRHMVTVAARRCRNADGTFAQESKL